MKTEKNGDRLNHGYQPSTGERPSRENGYRPNTDKGEKTPVKYVPPTKR